MYGTGAHGLMWSCYTSTNKPGQPVLYYYYFIFVFLLKFPIRPVYRLSLLNTGRVGGGGGGGGSGGGGGGAHLHFMGTFRFVRTRVESFSVNWLPPVDAFCATE